MDATLSSSSLPILAYCLLFVVLLWLHFYLQPQYLVALLQRLFDPRQVLFYHHGKTRSHTRPRVAFTIDDAPTASSHAILDCLAKHDVRATFFIISSQIPGREDVLRRMVQEGHELANHTRFDEPSWRLSAADFEESLLHCEQALEPFLPASSPVPATRWFRPGHGIVTPSLLQTCGRHQYRIALGSCFPNEANDKSLLQCTRWWINALYLRLRARPGCIVILHDRPWTVPTLEAALPGLTRRFALDTLSRLVEEP